MDLVAHEYANTGRLGEPIGLNVPALPRQENVPCGKQPDDVSRRGSGDEPDGRARGQPESVENPLLGDGIDRSAGRRRHPAVRGLVPGRHQPVGSQRHG